MPTVAIGASAPALAASTTACPTFAYESCWNCGFYNYVFMVTPTSLSSTGTGASIQTSGRITWPQNPAGSGTITISYALNLPAGTTISNVGLNGEWGNSGSWSGPVISGSTITYTVTTDTSPADMCGGISFDLNNFASPKTAAIDPTINFGSVPAGCAPNDGTTYTFERNVDPKIANYGATANCQDSAVWV